MDRELLLLGLLRQQRMHGYQLFEFIENTLSVCTDLKKPTAYYLLNKMARDGWITEQSVQDGPRPPRRVFTLTEAGEQTFQRLLREQLRRYEPVTFGGDIALAFLDLIDQEEAGELLAERRASLVKALDGLRSVPLHQGSLQLVITHQMRHLEAELAWLDEIIAEKQGNHG